MGKSRQGVGTTRHHQAEGSGYWWPQVVTAGTGYQETAAGSGHQWAPTDTGRKKAPVGFTRHQWTPVGSRQRVPPGTTENWAAGTTGHHLEPGILLGTRLQQAPGPAKHWALSIQCYQITFYQLLDTIGKISQLQQLQSMLMEG